MFPPSETYYRCYRCFTKFSPDDDASGDPSTRSVPPSSDPTAEPASVPDGDRPRAEIVDTRLELEERGAKYAVETFTVEIENNGDTPLRVTELTLAFDDGDERTTPKDDVVVPPTGTATVDVHWDWIHPDQRTVTIRARSNGDLVAAADVAISTP